MRLCFMKWILMLVMLFAVLIPAFSQGDIQTVFYIYVLPEGEIPEPVPVHGSLIKAFEERNISCEIIKNKKDRNLRTSKASDNEFLITVDNIENEPYKLALYKLKDYSESSKNLLENKKDWTEEDTSDVVSEIEKIAYQNIYEKEPDNTEVLPVETEDGTKQIPQENNISNEGKKPYPDTLPRNTPEGTKFPWLLLILLCLITFISLITSIVSLIMTSRTGRKISGQDSFEKLRSTITKHDIVPRFMSVTEKIDTRAEKSDITRVEKRIDSISEQIKNEISPLTQEFRKLKSDMEKLDTSIANLTMSPELNLFASGLRDFAGQIVEVYYEQDSGMTQRIKYVNLLKKIDASFNSWRKKLAVPVTGFKMRRTASGTSDQSLLKFAGDLLQKSEEYNISLQNLKKKFDSFQTGLKIPAFKEYCLDFLKDKSHLEPVIKQEDGLYREIVQGYSRLTAGEVLKNIGSVLDTRYMEDENKKFAESIKKWILSDLLLLCDYVNSFNEELEKNKPHVTPEISREFSGVIYEFNRFLKNIELEYISIRVKEDVFSSEFHQISRRMDNGQTILRIEKQGVIWRGEVLRKASVWVG